MCKKIAMSLILVVIASALCPQGAAFAQNVPPTIDIDIHVEQNSDGSVASNPPPKPVSGAAALLNIMSIMLLIIGVAGLALYLRRKAVLDERMRVLMLDFDDYSECDYPALSVHPASQQISSYAIERRQEVNHG